VSGQLIIANSQFNYPYDGTTVAIVYVSVAPGGGLLTKTGGGAFSIQQFDFAGWAFALDEHDFRVMGTRAGGSTITQLFTPDGLSDGQGGVADFQTFTLAGDWTNLLQVTWQHFGGAQGLTNGVAIDNVRVNEPQDLTRPRASVARSPRHRPRGDGGTTTVHQTQAQVAAIFDAFSRWRPAMAAIASYGEGDDVGVRIRFLVGVCVKRLSASKPSVPCFNACGPVTDLRRRRGDAGGGSQIHRRQARAHLKA
jgi:hypothetical protein